MAAYSLPTKSVHIAVEKLDPKATSICLFQKESKRCCITFPDQAHFQFLSFFLGVSFLGDLLGSGTIAGWDLAPGFSGAFLGDLLLSPATGAGCELEPAYNCFPW